MNMTDAGRQTARLSKTDLEDAMREAKVLSLVDGLFMLVGGRIRSRRFNAGQRLPSVRQLAEDCDVSRDTAARAYEKLVAHGVVDSRPGSGYFVRTVDQRTKVIPRRALFSGPGSHALTRWSMLLTNPDPALVSRTGSGVLPDTWLNEGLLSGAVKAVSRQDTRMFATHGDWLGYLPLREQLHLKLRQLGIHAEPNSIMTTHGAMEALHLVAQDYLRAPGETVLLEQPSPLVLAERISSAGMQALTVPRGDDGPDLAVLRELCEKHRPSLFFCSSVLHSPTSRNMAPHTAFQLLRLADEFNFMIVEDDTYGDLASGVDGAPLQRLATLDQLRRVIYIGSFSKTLAPGLRCGFLAANAETIDWLAAYRFVQHLGTSTFNERVVYRILSDGHYRRHCEQLRHRLAECRPKVLAKLAALGMEVETKVGEGLFVWASLGKEVNAMQVGERLLEQGHLIAPGELFSRDPEHQSWIRLNVAEAVDSGVFDALKKLLGRR